MKIEKSFASIGWWHAEFRLPTGELIMGTSENKLDALNQVFDKLKWLDVGNWNRVKERAEKLRSEIGDIYEINENND